MMMRVVSGRMRLLCRSVLCRLAPQSLPLGSGFLRRGVSGASLRSFCKSADTAQTHYEVLGVSPQATEKEIKSAYRKKALEWHPDRHQADKERATAMFSRISEAYQTLSNPSSRQQYDNSLRYGTGGAGSHPAPGDMGHHEQMFRDFFGSGDLRKIFEQFGKGQAFRGFSDMDDLFRSQSTGSHTIVQKSTMKDQHGRTIERTVRTTIFPDGSRTVQTDERVVG